MRKKSLKILAMFFGIALIISMLCVPALAADDDPIIAQNNHGDTFTNLKDAVEFTYEDWTTGTVTLTAREYELEADITIPRGITLTIPSSSSLNDTTSGHNFSGGIDEENAKVYATLTVPADKSITVNGVLLVAGNQQSTQPESGFLSGAYGAIDLQGNITVGSGGVLYARGEISGLGKVTAMSGGSVYQRFEIADWRGGTASRAANRADVFPFNLYQLGGIDAEAIYENGSSLYGQAYIYASGLSTRADIHYIGSSALVEFTGTGGNVTMTKKDGITTATVNGAIKTGTLRFDFNILGIPIPITSEGKDCPFGYNLNLVMAAGSSLDVNVKLKMLPGCTFTVSDGATVTLSEGGAMYFYGAETYSPNYFFHRTTETGEVALDWNYKAAATLVNNGTVTLNGGTIGSTVSSFINVGGFTSTGTTVDVLEYNQTSGKLEVPFYVGTYAPAA